MEIALLTSITFSRIRQAHATLIFIYRRVDWTQTKILYYNQIQLQSFYLRERFIT